MKQLATLPYSIGVLPAAPRPAPAARDLRALDRALGHLLAGLSVECLLDRMVEEVKATTRADVAIVSVFRPVGWQPTRGAGTRYDDILRRFVPGGVGLEGRVLETGLPKRVPDYLSDASITHELDALILEEGLHACMGVPCLVGDWMPGSFFLARRGRAPFSRGEEARALRVAAAYAPMLQIVDLGSKLQGALRTLPPRRWETPGPPPPASPSGLTEREVEVLTLVAEGQSSKQTAATLGIRAKTVRTHLSNAYRKTGLADRAQVVRYALREGLASLD